HAEAHGAHEDRQRGRLREQADVPVIERRREIEHLVDDRREGRPHERTLHLIGRRVQALADDLGGDGVGVGGAARAAGTCPRDDRLCAHSSPPLASISAPVWPTVARNSRSTYVVAVCSRMIAGPSTRAPAPSVERSTTTKSASA